MYEPSLFPGLSTVNKCAPLRLVLGASLRCGQFSSLGGISQELCTTITEQGTPARNSLSYCKRVCRIDAGMTASVLYPNMGKRFQ